MRIYVDIVTKTWGETNDLRLLELDDKLLEDLCEDEDALVRLATAYGKAA